MRPRSLLAVVLGTLAMATSVRAQGYPADMTITVPEVEVRSGPTKEYYPTGKLRFGDRVLVLRESKDQPGWLAIRPPQGSFSWINAKAIKQIDARTGVVESDAGAMLRPGSSIANKEPNMESVKVPLGSIVTILDKGVTADSNTWLPIQPWPTEVRYIPGDAVQARQFAGNNSANINGPATFTSNPWITQADQAFQAGNVEKAKQLYKEAAERTSDNTQKIYCYNRLASLSQSPWNAGQSPGHPSQMNQGQAWQVGQTASFTQNNGAAQKLTYPPQWSQVGILRRAAFDKDGQQTYVLEGDRGQVLLYVTCLPGETLRDHIGRRVALYGSITYRSDDYLRTHFLTPIRVALY